VFIRPAQGSHRLASGSLTTLSSPDAEGTASSSSPALQPRPSINWNFSTIGTEWFLSDFFKRWQPTPCQ
jgi:hypothetical protein